MFYYLIYNSTIIKKENNKNVSTLIYGTIIYIVIHAFINFNKTLKENLIRYFWLFFSVDELLLPFSVHQIFPMPTFADHHQ